LDKVESKIQASNRGNVDTQLKQEFISSKLQKGESPDEWIEKLKSIRNTVEQILEKQHIDDTDMMWHILNNLPEKYVLKMQDNQGFHCVIFITTLDIQVKLLSVVRRGSVLN
jgi:gag-polypeptide of LTR copia-type